MKIITNIQKAFYRSKFAIEKRSPELLLVAGIGLGISAAVTACKATIKMQDIKAEREKKIEEIKEFKPQEGESYSEDDRENDIGIVNAQTGMKIARAYLLPIGLGLVSVSCIMASHGIMRKRNAALSVAYTTVSNAFQEYRKRVIADQGKGKDFEYRFGTKAEEISKTETDENGKKVKSKEVIQTAPNGIQLSEYAVIFDEKSRCFKNDRGYNYMWLTALETQFNNDLILRGHVYLNDIYRALDLPETKAGQVVGWVYDKSNEHMGDNYISFGLSDVYSNVTMTDDPAIVLDFNPDGDIWSRLRD